MIKFLKQKNSKKRKFIPTLTFTSLRRFLDVFPKKFNIFFNGKSEKVNEQHNEKTVPKLIWGFTLVETLIALSIFTVSIVALMSVLAQGISDIGYAKRKTIAGYLAQEGIEHIRNMRDGYVLYSEETGNNWTKFKAKLSSCNLNGECGFDNSVYPTDADFIFKCTSNPNGCILYLNNGNYNSNSIGNDSGFTRKIWMSTINSDEVKIFSTVSWIQGSGPFNVTFSENLFNWIES